MASQWSWIHTAWYLIVFPAVLWTVLVILSKVVGRFRNVGHGFRVAATGAFPIVAAGHAAKALAKLNSWAGFLGISLADPNGVPAASAIVEGTRAAPGHLVPFATVAVAAVCLSVAVCVLAWRRVDALEGQSRTVGRLAVAVSALLYCGVLFLWPFAH